MAKESLFGEALFQEKLGEILSTTYAAVSYSKILSKEKTESHNDPYMLPAPLDHPSF